MWTKKDNMAVLSLLGIEEEILTVEINKNAGDAIYAHINEKVKNMVEERLGIVMFSQLPEEHQNAMEHALGGRLLNIHALLKQPEHERTSIYNTSELKAQRKALSELMLYLGIDLISVNLLSFTVPY